MRKNNVIAIIPARGGSKTIPRKNLRLLNGRPLIYYTIESAKKSKKLDGIYVSTDDKDIAKIAKENGVKVINRPEKYAQDDTLDLPVFKHAIEYLKGSGVIVDVIVNLRPTAPLRSIDDIDNAIQMLIDESADSIRSVNLVSEHPYWMFNLDKKNRLIPFNTKNSIKKYPRRQLLPNLFIINGNIDVMRSDNIINGELYGKNILGLETEEKNSVDIDTELDFKLAEVLINEKDSRYKDTD